MSNDNLSDVSRKEKLDALVDVAKFNPKLTSGIIILGIVAALFEGIGMSFIIPIIEIIQAESDPAANANGLLAVFVTLYQLLKVPFTLEFVIFGVATVISLRYTASFVVAWLRAALSTYYTRDLQDRSFEKTLDAQIKFFDNKGSDDILNTVVTESLPAGRLIRICVQFIEQIFITLVYCLIAVIVSPILSLSAALVLGGFIIITRHIVEPGYDLGDRVAKANEERQEAVQAGTQGIRDIRLFDMTEEVYEAFVDAVDKYTRTRIRLRRNEAAINKFYNLIVVISMFVLIYFALSFANLPFSELAVFLFAMFRLGPRVSNLNQKFYQIERTLPHLVRTLEFINKVERHKEPTNSSREMPAKIEHIEFDDVWFSYDEKQVLRGVHFEVVNNEFVAFVGQSGAGKSTIVSLLARMYEPNRGEIRVNNIPITDFDQKEFRDHIAMVRQSPFIFNDTLRYNLTIGNRTASEAEIKRVCGIAKVDEFIDDLPNGYESMLGDEGVRLSGGQKQRVALARALLKDADLLLLDEATSDLDTGLEKEVQQAIEEMDRNYTIITIAHRLSTVENADRIYTIENGRILECGTHQELLQKNDKYAELKALQSQ